MESARLDYFRLGGLADLMTSHGAGPILASIKCDFRRQLNYPDTVQIGARIDSIGRTSLRMSHLIYSTQQRAIAAEGESVLVMFDYVGQRPNPVPDTIRHQIDKLEGRI